MRFAACVRTDMREGFSETRGRLFLVTAVATGVIGFSLLVARATGHDVLSLSLGDAFAACFGGMGVFDPERDRFFRFPAAWMLVLATISLVTLSYPYRDLEGFGRSVLVASGSRRSWWLSKCLWVVMAADASCAVAGLVCFGATVVTRGSLDLTVGTDALGTFLRMPPGHGASLDVTAFALGVPCMMAALCLMQMAVSLVVGPALSFGATVGLLLVSAYVFSPVLPGNYLMVARTGAVLDGGTDPVVGLALAFVMGATSASLGGLLFSRMDCMDKEGS